MLEKICSGNQDVYGSLKEMIQRSSNIYLNLSEDDIDKVIADETSILYGLINESKAKLPKSKLAVFSDLKAGKMLLDIDLQGFFILDVSATDAINLSNKLGIMVLAESNISAFSWDFFIGREFTKGDIVRDKVNGTKGWQVVLADFSTQSSNASIIIDRNMFSNKDNRKNLGLYNIVTYFDNVLPTKLEVDYHILLIADNKDKKQEVCLRDLVTELQQLRSYNIEVELLLVHSSMECYSHTHERRVLKNYHVGSTEHGFTVFREFRHSEVYKDNNLYLWGHYYSIIKDKQTYSLDKAKKMKKRLVDIKKNAEDKLASGNNNYEFKLFLNGKPSKKIKNRLLN